MENEWRLSLPIVIGNTWRHEKKWNNNNKKEMKHWRMTFNSGFAGGGGRWGSGRFWNSSDLESCCLVRIYWSSGEVGWGGEFVSSFKRYAKMKFSGLKFFFFTLKKHEFYSILYHNLVLKLRDNLPDYALTWACKTFTDWPECKWDGWMASPTQWTRVWVCPGVGNGQGGLACSSPWGLKELDMTEWLNSRVQITFKRKFCRRKQLITVI